MRVFSETIDVFKGFQYVIPQRLASHQSPYVKVRWQNQGVAYILLKTKKIEFYEKPNRYNRKLDRKKL